MPFGIGRKMEVEPTFDRDSYAPGEAVRIVALAHGESDDRVRGGKASLWLRVELRNARGIAPGKTTPSGTWAERNEKGKAMLERIDPTADGTPRVAGSLTIPPDASPLGGVGEPDDRVARAGRRQPQGRRPGPSRDHHRFR